MPASRGAWCFVPCTFRSADLETGGWTFMPATTNKQRLLNHLFSLAKKMGESKDVPARPVLEQFIYGLCREGTTRAQADKAFQNLAERFFDWNEVRVSSQRELEEALAGLPDAEA